MIPPIGCDGLNRVIKRLEWVTKAKLSAVTANRFLEQKSLLPL